LNRLQGPSGPFSGYRVTLAPKTSLPMSTEADPVLATLTAGGSVVISERDAAALYERIEAAATARALRFPLRFVPIRCNRKRALPFESVAISAVEVLHIVHEGFFGALRCREAAIAAVQACGALPVPTIGLGPVARRAPREVAERHVDALIDRESELRMRDRQGGA
jgi:hypothetical protein